MGTIIHPGTAREIITEGQPVLFGLNDVNDILWAIQLALGKIDEDIETFKEVALNLRAGKHTFPFAEGEAGAVAAERLVNSFIEGADRLNSLRDVIVNCDSIIAIDLSNAAVA
jgi:hypothetical protein